MSSVEDEDWDELEGGEEDDFALTGMRQHLMTLPDDITKGVSPESFSVEKKNFALQMLANDPKTLLDHQRELADLVIRHASEAFTVAYEATMGAGKTMSILALAGTVPKTGRKVLYVCPEQQRSVRLEVARLLFSSMAVHTDAGFVWAEFQGGKLQIRYSAHVIWNRMPAHVEEGSCAALDYHGVVVASTRAAAAILEARPDLDFLLFFDEFLSEAGTVGTGLHESIRLLKTVVMAPTPQLVLSSATRLNEPALNLFRALPNMHVSRIASSKHLVPWNVLAGVAGEVYPHHNCHMANHPALLKEAISQPTFARLVTKASCSALAQDLEVEVPQAELAACYDKALEVLQRWPLRIRELCADKMPAAKISFSKLDLLEITRSLGKTTALLATNHVEAATTAYFSKDIEHIRSKMLKDENQSVIATLAKQKQQALDKLFAKCFLRKPPFSCVLEQGFQSTTRSEEDMIILLIAGIGVFTDEINQARPQYANFVAERAQHGHLHLLVADATVAHGVNFRISNVILAPSIVQECTPATVFQLLGRAGRRGLSTKADVHGNLGFFEMLKKGLLGEVDIFEAESDALQQSWEQLGVNAAASKSLTSSGPPFKISSESTVDSTESEEDAQEEARAVTKEQPVRGNREAPVKSNNDDTSPESWFPWVRKFFSGCCFSREEPIR
ncbi:unnamed protein product [Symbiodinium sp. CCMP2592]|nr:unnamed protein product [Symbiodinium sp. CCMP2592]